MATILETVKRALAQLTNAKRDFIEANQATQANFTQLKKENERLKEEISQLTGKVDKLLEGIEAGNLIVQGKVGIGTDDPKASLHVRGGSLMLDRETPWIYGGAEPGPTARYLGLLDFPIEDAYDKVMGLKAGGVLVSKEPGYKGSPNPANGNLIVHGKVGIGTDEPTSELHVKGTINAKDIQINGVSLSEKYAAAGANGTASLPKGTEILRMALPIPLTEHSQFVDVPNDSSKWTTLTTTTYGENYSAIEDSGKDKGSVPVIKGSKRVYKIAIRCGNDGQNGQSDSIQYRLSWSWVNKPHGKPDNKVYSGSVQYGALDEGKWDIIELDHLRNPGGDTAQHHHWRLEGLASGCKNRVHSVTLLLIDRFE